MEQRDKGTTNQTAAKKARHFTLLRIGWKQLSHTFPVSSSIWTPTPLNSPLRYKEVRTSFTFLFVLALPVLGIGPGGPKEGQPPHQEVGKVGKGVEHQKRRDLIRKIFKFSRQKIVF